MIENIRSISKERASIERDRLLFESVFENDIISDAFTSDGIRPSIDDLYTELDDDDAYKNMDSNSVDEIDRLIANIPVDDDEDFDDSAADILLNAEDDTEDMVAEDIFGDDEDDEEYEDDEDDEDDEDESDDDLIGEFDFE